MLGKFSFRRYINIAAVVAAVFAFAYGKATAEDAPSSNAVTADIQAGIEKHIEEETSRGGGYFKFTSAGREYAFKLVRVHTEYLANLGARKHFACVDLVDTSGDVYDVDFFLSGDPGAMAVTETTLHKRNGIPFYAWEEDKKGAWKRVPIKGAPLKLLGVIRGRDNFEFHYRVKLPSITNAGRLWIPYPQTDAFQKVELISINASINYRTLDETKYGNKVFFFELTPKDSAKTIDIRYRVQRSEKPAYAAPDDDPQRYLEPDILVPTDKNFEEIAQAITKGKKGILVRARALYDYIIDSMRYMKYGSGWGKGDAAYACNIRTGNCTDYHSFFISLARAAGIPARFAIGAAIPSERDNSGIDGYHCWAEFYAEGKWYPVDISEADKYSGLATYYFGHHPANRLELSRGRDLTVDPGPASGPINFLAYPVLEINNDPVKIVPEFSFTRKKK
ncbi:transglutaminase domain-containing protein [bacterium]|nr:MAG: transglutaminase domain-containing protein [bacterium]